MRYHAPRMPVSCSRCSRGREVPRVDGHEDLHHRWWRQPGDGARRQDGAVLLPYHTHEVEAPVSDGRSCGRTRATASGCSRDCAGGGRLDGPAFVHRGASRAQLPSGGGAAMTGAAVLLARSLIGRNVAANGQEAGSEARLLDSSASRTTAASAAGFGSSG